MGSINNLRFDFEWQDPAGARGEELRATWASLSILIDDKPVTELQDRRTRSVRTSIFLPLFPLAEWIASNWWFLQSEVERPGTAESREFDHRHNLRWAREGFVLPSLRFVTLGENVEAQWSPLDIPDAGIRFLASGHAVLSGTACREILGDFVSAVVARLDDSGVSATTLHDEWAAIQNADVDEQDFCHAAARLGVDPYAINDGLESEIVSVAGKIRPELFHDFLSLATVDELASQATALETASSTIALDTEVIDALDRVRSLAPPLPRDKNPWETGYHFAAELRAKLNGRAWKSRSLDDLAGHLSIDQLDACLLPTSDGCRFLDALAGANQHNNPKFLIEKKRPDSRQFAFCRALFEHLTSSRDRFAAVSGLRTDQQQRNRAFAAEFLAPHEILKGDLSGATVGEDEIAELADEYGVSEFVIRHQIENHQLAHVSL
ncbi:MAG: hypothetical protein WD049_03265 [Candidatus Paceibacterota bacterium]